MNLNKRIKNFTELQKLLKKGYFDVKIGLAAGLYTRKTVYQDLGVFNYVDETEVIFKNKVQAKKYWQDYFKKFPIFFDGYN